VIWSPRRCSVREIRVMAGDQDTVFGDHQVHLDHVGAELDGAGIGLDRLLGHVPRSAPVRHHQRRAIIDREQGFRARAWHAAGGQRDHGTCGQGGPDGAPHGAAGKRYGRPHVPWRSEHREPTPTMTVQSGMRDRASACKNRRFESPRFQDRSTSVSGSHSLRGRGGTKKSPP